jgi:hypothetical protein
VNLFKDNIFDYNKKNLPIIPDRFKGKTPLIKGWSDYCSRLPTRQESEQWSSAFDKSNIALCLGQQSRIIALDLDTVRQDILDIILPMLPYSPIVKKGAKGETRFFKYSGEHTDKVTFDGECIIEILSTGKKTTIPPSIHPNGMAYKWTTDATLLNYDLSLLPLLPPMLFSHIQSTLVSKLGGSITINKNKINTSGRNNDMVSLCGRLIKERVDLNKAVQTMIETDEKTNNPPLFTDSNEFKHTEKFSNALSMYNNVLFGINNKHFRENTSYEVPIMPGPVSESLKSQELMGKTTKSGKSKKVSSRICQWCGGNQS